VPVENAIYFDVARGDSTIGTGQLSGIVRSGLDTGWLGLSLEAADEDAQAEAFVLLLRVAFEDLGLHRLEISVSTEDEVSMGRLRALGGREEV